MEKNEILINHHGKYFVGTVSDYISLCTSDPHNDVPFCGREATIEDIFDWEKKLIKGGILKSNHKIRR